MRLILCWLPPCLLTLLLAVPALTNDRGGSAWPPRPRVPGKLHLNFRERKEKTPGSKLYKPVARAEDWNVAETAIIICDMWDDGFCKIANQRAALMVPRMNAVVSAARDHGVMIIHAPSATMNMYADSPHRRIMTQAKPAKSPVPIQAACSLDTAREPALPVDTSKCGCDDPGWVPSCDCIAGSIRG